MNRISEYKKNSNKSNWDEDSLAPSPAVLPLHSQSPEMSSNVQVFDSSNSSSRRRGGMNVEGGSSTLAHYEEDDSKGKEKGWNNVTGIGMESRYPPTPTIAEKGKWDTLIPVRNEPQTFVSFTLIGL